MPLTKNQALGYYRSDDLIGLGMEADALRHRLHPEGVVTYILDRKIQYTSSPSTAGAGLAAVNRPGQLRQRDSNQTLDQHRSAELNEDPATDFESICRQIAETIEIGGTGIRLQGTSDLEIASSERLLREIRRKFPQLTLECFSAPEILAIAAHSGLSVRDSIARLRDAGLDSIPGDGAGILDNNERRRVAQQCSTEDWLHVHRTAHQLGMRTTSAMTFGRGETFEERVHHLEEIRRLQEETGGFAAFFPLNFKPENAASQAQSTLENGNFEESTAVEYLKVLAIARLYLDTIENMRCSWAAQGLKVLQLSLRFGGNDAGPVMPGENPIRAAAAPHPATEEQLRHVIRGAGFKPVQRDALYTTCFLN
jgi:cyclic dehypoxanthinyl futalosine synthase